MTTYLTLPPPEAIKAAYPLLLPAENSVARARQTIQEILRGLDPRLLVIVGPCSIHNTQAAYDYAVKLRHLAAETKTTLYIAMRTYCEKSRTTHGWKGLLYDPHLDGSHDIVEGLKVCRQLLLELTALGVPTAAELLDPCAVPYLSDLLSWACIGARTATSQIHRLMASGLSMPVAFKNSLDGNIDNAIWGASVASHPQCYMGVDDFGQLSSIMTKGNHCAHVVLRGGDQGVNCNRFSIDLALTKLKAAGITEGLIVDCSHGNSNRDYRQQGPILHSLLDAIDDGARQIRGVIIESNLEEGCQSIKDGIYGTSITDPCLGWHDTEQLLLSVHKRLCTKTTDQLCSSTCAL